MVSIKAIFKRKLFEVMISPGYYIAATAGLIVAYVLVTGFADSIGSSGFNREQASPVYALLFDGMGSIMGSTFVEKLFSEGPFLFALIVSYAPVLLYLSFSSVFKFGFEKNVGAIELITYGPADGTSYFMASLLKDMAFAAAYQFLLLVFFILAALLNNLILGPMFFYSFILLFFLTFSIFAFCVFSSVLSENAATAVAIFGLVMLFFLVIQIVSYSLVGGYIKNLSDIFIWIMGWISPLTYWNLALGAVDCGNTMGFFLFLLLQVLLCAVYIVSSHFILKRKGVRG